jgi:hypothetical protein
MARYSRVHGQTRRAASMAAMSIFFIVIIASKARFASPPPAASASVSARGVICQERPQRSLHQPHWLSVPPLPTIAWRRRSAPPQARPCRTRGRSCSLASCFLLLVLARSGRAAEIRDGDIYRESSHIQLTSHVFPPSDEKDCSIRDDLGEMSSQT